MWGVVSGFVEMHLFHQDEAIYVKMCFNFASSGGNGEWSKKVEWRCYTVLGVVGLGYAKHQRADRLGELQVVGLGYVEYQQTDQWIDGLGELHTLEDM